MRGKKEEVPPRVGAGCRGLGGGWTEAPLDGMVQEEPHHTALLSKQQEQLEGSGRWTGRPIGGGGEKYWGRAPLRVCQG